MKVIILGASGFIGFPVAQALVRAGHVVYGQTRSESKAKNLATDEIIPIVADPADIEPWKSHIATADAVIDASRGDDLEHTSSVILESVSAAAKSLRPAFASKLTFIYVSGTWVHGENRKEFVSDTTACTNPVPMAAWRVGREQEIIKSQVLNGIVIRPSMLYGRSGSLLSTMFQRAYEGKLVWYGRPGGRYAMIHQDDLADLVLKATEKSAVIGGCIFDATNEHSESVDDILNRLCEISGVKDGYSYVEASNPFEEALQTSVLIRPYLARTLLGWRPLKASLADGLDTYYAAWKASVGL